MVYEMVRVIPHHLISHKLIVSTCMKTEVIPSLKPGGSLNQTLNDVECDCCTNAA